MSKESKFTRKVNLFFDEALYQDLKRLADRKPTTLSEIVREACRKYVAERKRIERMHVLKK